MPSNNDQAQSVRFPDRADSQSSDVEVLPGETATLDGVAMTVASPVSYTTSINEYTKADAGKTYLVVNVTIKNGSSETKAYNVFDFRIQTAGGQVLDPSIMGSNTLGSGDLVAGGTAQGSVTFEVPVETGAEYIIWKPSAFSSDRAVVQVKQ